MKIATSTTSAIDRQSCSSSGGSPCSSASLVQASAISVRSSRSTASALPSHDKVRTSNPCGPAAELRQHKASHLVDHGLVRVALHQGALLLLDPDAQQCRLPHEPQRAAIAARRKYRR
jgi:hypothetical protein